MGSGTVSHAATPAETWLRSLADLFFPPRCAACRIRIEPSMADDGFCPACAQTLVPLTPPACEICAEPYPSASPAPITCPNCHGQSQPFEFATSGWLFRGALREAIHRFKYQSALHLRRPLARYLMDARNDPRIAGEASWILVPVPLHPRRLRERQFNQAAEVAQCLSRVTGYPVVPALRRIRYTSTQVRLRQMDRRRNLRGAFDLCPKTARSLSLTGRNVLLVDDVFTSGATAGECSLTLRRLAAPARIAVITIARG